MSTLVPPNTLESVMSRLAVPASAIWEAFVSYVPHCQPPRGIEYLMHINALSKLIGGTTIDAESALRVETALAAASLPGEERRDPDKLYIPMSLSEVEALAPLFPWKVFLAEDGISGVETINVAVPDALM